MFPATRMGQGIPERESTLHLSKLKEKVSSAGGEREPHKVRPLSLSSEGRRQPSLEEASGFRGRSLEETGVVS